MTKTEVQNFKKLWEGEIAKIENRVLDIRATRKIIVDFQLQRTKLEMFMTEEEFDKKYLDLDGLESRLEIALETARSNHTLQNHSFLVKLTENIAKICYSISDAIQTIIKR